MERCGKMWDRTCFRMDAPISEKDETNVNEFLQSRRLRNVPIYRSSYYYSAIQALYLSTMLHFTEVDSYAC